MKQPGSATLNEIITQPDAWAETITVAQEGILSLTSLWETKHVPDLVFTGCGSTYYLSLAAAALARQKGLVASAVPGSELWLRTGTAVPRPNHSLLIAVSRSGETSETLRGVDAYRKAGGRSVVVVTCYPESTLAKMGDLVFNLPKAQEQSVAQTRSFASMLLACEIIITWLQGQTDPARHLYKALENALRPQAGDEVKGIYQIPAKGASLIAAYHDLAARLGADRSIQRFFFLGSGPLYGLACEAMLKMKEMSLSYSEAYHVLEFRHGPKSMVDVSSLVVGLLSEAAFAEEFAVLADMRLLGARTLALAPAGKTDPSIADALVTVPSDGSSISPSLVFYLPILQLLAYHRARSKDLDPDGPRNLTAVVTL